MIHQSVYYFNHRIGFHDAPRGFRLRFGGPGRHLGSNLEGFGAILVPFWCELAPSWGIWPQKARIR